MTVVLAVIILVMGEARGQAEPTTAPTTAETAASPGASEGKGAVRTLFSKLYAGGPIVGVQVLLSVVGLGVAIERLMNQRRALIAPRGLTEAADRAWGQDGPDAAVRVCREQPSVLGVAIAALAQHNDGPRGEALTAAAAAGRPLLRRHIQKSYPIAIIAMLQPLLGLFGTVWGLIGAFDAIALAGAMGNPSIFADEIALALVTTAVGLAIAIPLLGLYHWFKSRVQGMGTEIEEQLLHLADHHFGRRRQVAGGAASASLGREEVAGVRA